MSYKSAIMAYEPINAQEANDKMVMLDYIALFEHNILTRSNAFAHITSSGLILNRSLTKMLMIHHNIYQTWTWTGGHADGDSDMLYVALKEAREETGIDAIEPLMSDIASLDIIPVYGHVKNGAYVSSHLHLNTSFVLIADEDAETSVKVDETSDIRWVALSEMPDYSNEPYLIEIYNKLISRAKSYIEQK